jgi:hypothetical protein
MADGLVEYQSMVGCPYYPTSGAGAGAGAELGNYFECAV